MSQNGTLGQSTISRSVTLLLIVASGANCFVCHLTLAEHKIVKEMQITTADIRNERQLVNAMRGVDVVIHCAALVDVGFYQNKDELHSVNVEGTWRLWPLSKKLPVTG